MMAQRPDKPMNIFLYEPSGAGHHPMYLRVISQALLDMGHRVTAFGHRDGLLGPGGQAGRYTAVEVGYPPFSQARSTTLRLALNAWRGWMLARRNIRRHIRQGRSRPDLVFFPYLDFLLAPLVPPVLLDRVFGLPWSGIYLRVGFLRAPASASADQRHSGSLPGRLKRRLTGSLFPSHLPLRSRYCKAVALLEEDLVEHLGAILNKPVVAFPDFTDASTGAATDPVVEQLRRFKGERKLVLMIGALAERKGLFTLLEAAQLLEDAPVCFGFVGGLHLAKEASRRHPLLENPPPNCFLHAQRVEQESDFNALVQMSDLVYAAYENFQHSSNMIIKAATFEKPIIVSDGCLMARRVERFRLGGIVGSQDSREIRDTIEAMLDPGALAAWRRQAGFEAYRERHSIEALHGALARLCHCVAQQPSAEPQP